MEGRMEGRIEGRRKVGEDSPKCTERLIIIDICGGERGDHDGFGVSTESVLQEFGERRVSVRDHHLLLAYYG